MVEYKYGEFSDRQFDEFKTKLHKDVFWLLLFKDPELADQFGHVDFDKYYNGLIRKIAGLNDILGNPAEVVELISMLEAAYKETTNDCLDFLIYRKLVLDAHKLIDKIGLPPGSAEGGGNRD